MMKQLLSIAAFFAVLAFGAFAYAQEGQQSNPWKRYADMREGTFRINDQKTGEFKTLVVVGSTPVSTAFAPARAKNLARRKASMICNSEFAKWCETNLEYNEDAEDGNIFSVKNEDEEGKASEDQNLKLKQFAQKAISGLEVVYSEFDAEEGDYVIVKAWNLKGANAVRKVNRALRSVGEDNNPRPVPQNAGNGEGTPAKPARGSFKSESHVAPGADEFL